jgi:hypothetical protein
VVQRIVKASLVSVLPCETAAAGFMVGSVPGPKLLKAASVFVSLEPHTDVYDCREGTTPQRATVEV